METLEPNDPTKKMIQWKNHHQHNGKIAIIENQHKLGILIKKIDTWARRSLNIFIFQGQEQKNKCLIQGSRVVNGEHVYWFTYNSKHSFSFDLIHFNDTKKIDGENSQLDPHDKESKIIATLQYERDVSKKRIFSQRTPRVGVWRRIL